MLARFPVRLVSTTPFLLLHVVHLATSLFLFNHLMESIVDALRTVGALFFIII